MESKKDFSVKINYKSLLYNMYIEIHNIRGEVF